jgi:tetratricopeptide (TPR) repeat protein
MKYRSWFMAVGLGGGCLAISLAASSSPAIPSHDAKKSTKQNSFRPPLVVDNPYAALTPQAAPSETVTSEASNKSAISGFQADPDAPTIYRLPSVDIELAAAPAPVEETVAASTEEPYAASEAVPVPSSADRSATVAVNDDILPIPGAPDTDTPPTIPESGPSFAAAPEPASTDVADQPPKSTAAFSANSAEMVPYMPVTAGLSAQLLPAVQRAYGLAQRGSLYSAQTEFIQVLRRIAQAKDADEGYDDHSRALAAGLRALDEADDFAPSGVQLESEMNVAVTVSSHRTPVLRDCGDNVLPQEAIAQYHFYAQHQLALAVDGEQAGSMALHGLGKVYCRQAEETSNDSRHDRKAMTMFLAALDAGPQNNLAANEVGVLLSRGGHDAEAAAMFKRAIDLAPTSTAYRNLAACEQKLGDRDHANADSQYAEQLASRERATSSVSRSLGIRWVSPQELASVAQPQPLPPAQIAGQSSVASRPNAPLGPSPAPNSAEPTHAPKFRWW